MWREGREHKRGEMRMLPMDLWLPRGRRGKKEGNGGRGGGVGACGALLRLWKSRAKIASEEFAA